MLSKTVYRGLIPCYRLDTITTTLVVDLGDDNNRFHSAHWLSRSTVRSWDAHTGSAKERGQSIEQTERGGDRGVGKGDTLVMRAACWL